MDKKKRFSHCPLCGNLFKGKSGYPLTCSVCGFHFFYDPHVGTGAIVENGKGEILLLKRREAPKKGYWNLPGGFVSIDETAEHALAREIKEEIGASATHFTYAGSYRNQYFYQGITYHVMDLAFVVKIKNMKFKPNSEIAEARFSRKRRSLLGALPFRASSRS